MALVGFFFLKEDNLFWDYSKKKNLHTTLSIYIPEYLTKASSDNSILKTILLCKWPVQLPNKWLQKPPEEK